MMLSRLVINYLHSFGASEKDLDIILYPLQTGSEKLGLAYKFLNELGMKRLHNKEVVQKRWRRLGSMDEKHVEIWEYDSRRVDLMFLR